MRKTMMRIALAALALMLTCSALAADFDMDRAGSISVLIHTAKDQRVQNAKIELYRVGDPRIEDSNLVFDLSADFSGSGVSLGDLNSAGLADKLSLYAQSMNVESYAVAVTGEDGRVLFGDLPVGLYMVKQNGFAKKEYFTEIAPFLVSMPMTQNSAWVYAIDASPKVDAKPKPTAAPEPTDAPTDETLPQTGMLRWPIPVLGVGGLLLFSLGWALCFIKKKDA